ncbi:hypothetical protein ACFRH4_04385 [Streptomyces mirabilis]|uniref:hypothetical protein n=1 Tax=Streptomyces mirabilis TaxID=68239 RepID=UPI0036B9EFCC
MLVARGDRRCAPVRFRRPDVLLGRAAPRHYESDTVVLRGHVTEQGSKLVRWAVVEAIQRKTTLKITEDRIRIEARLGRGRRAVGQLSDPLHGAVAVLIDSACRTSHRSMRPRATKE